MKRTLNFWINAAIYLLMAFLLFSGLLMKYTMPPGTGGRLEFLGLGRHDWGTWHFWIAVVLLVGVALHLYLHWVWIRQTTPRYWGKAWIPVVAALLVLAAAAIAAPFIITPAEVPGGGEYHERNGFGSQVPALSAALEDGQLRKGLQERIAESCETCAEDCAEELAREPLEDAEEESDGSGVSRRLRGRGSEGT